MTFVVTLAGIAIVVLGAIGFGSPPRILGLVDRMATQSGLYVIAGIRLCLGVAFLLAAEGSRAPLYLQIIGVLALISGAITPFLGVEFVARILAWWRERPVVVTRLWCLVVVLFGASLVWAAMPGAV